MVLGFRMGGEGSCRFKAKVSLFLSEVTACGRKFMHSLRFREGGVWP